MRQVKLSNQAYGDLDAIWDYIAPRNFEAAEKLIGEITEKFALLSQHPLIGRRKDDLIIDLRSFAVRDYLIFYQPIEDGIEVIRILHSSRDIESEFERFFDAL
ncbi:MAG: type II toxin-antitoxin system RelE/ParE family toxin [Blastocatellia bacterium]